MYCIIKNNKVICTTDSKPSLTDLSSRGETFVEAEANIGDIYDGQNFSPPPVSTEELLIAIRRKRDSLLSQSDKYMLSDYPIGTLTREEWNTKVTTYRQSLRDFPEACDLNNPIWPTL